MSLLKRLASLLGGRRTDARAAQGESQSPPSEASPAERPVPADADAERLIGQICEEALAAEVNFDKKLAASAAWRTLNAAPAEQQRAVLFAALSAYLRGGDRQWQIRELHKSMVTRLLRRDLPLTADHLVELLTAWLAQRHGLEYGLPGPTILGAVERHAATGDLPGSLRGLLKRIRDKAQGGWFPGQPPNKALRSIADRAERLLHPAPLKARPVPKGPFAKWLAGRPAVQQAAWQDLIALAADGADKSKPTKKWLAGAGEAITRVGRAEVTRELLAALDATTPDPARPDDSLDILKGLIWASVALDHGDLVGPLGRFAETCFRKVPGMGARSVALGNAALWALAEMADEPRAAAELFRLRDRIRYPSTRRTIDGRLGDLADASGQSVESLEDLSLPDFGLDADGRLTFEVGDARAVLTVQAHATEVQWFNAEGRALKSVPAEARKAHAAPLAEMRRRVKEIEEARAGQALRLESSWLEERDWRFSEWTDRYQGHPLRRPLVEALIWRIGDQDAMAEGGTFVDADGRPVDVGPDARVRLWHPLDAAPEAVLAWRRRILDRGVTQPVKQAHREIYVLTDAERQTGVYSNRFAAHILRQHQFRALCQARGWTYNLMGGWDGWNQPRRGLPKQRLAVEYEVAVVDDGRQSASGVALYVTTDQVRFVPIGDRHNNPSLPLDQVAPIVFSEVLRDVDLFVAVASVANDPGWTDGGPDGRHGGYWREWAFGELGQSAQTRRELISWIVPKLSIADRLEITDKALVVTGRKQRYAIHFGSANIQILPGNRYLCIVPNRDPTEAARLKLPFTGDDTLSAILSKAFLLVDESKITDRTILSQL